MLSVQPGLRSSNDLRVGRKMAIFHLFFQSREQVVVRRGQIRRIGWVIKTLEAQVGQFLLSCKCPVSFGSRRKNSKSCSDDCTVDIFIHVQAFEDPLHGEISHVQIFMNDGPNPLT